MSVEKSARIAEHRAEVRIGLPERVVVLALADHHDLHVDRDRVGLERAREPEQAGRGGADLELAGLDRPLQRHPRARLRDELDGVHDQEPAVGLQQRAAADRGRVGAEAHRPVLDAVDRPGQRSAGPGTAPSPPARRSARCGRRSRSRGSARGAPRAAPPPRARRRAAPRRRHDVVAHLVEERLRWTGRGRGWTTSAISSSASVRAAVDDQLAERRRRTGAGARATMRASSRSSSESASSRASFAANSASDSAARSCSSGTGWPSFTGTISGCDERPGIDLDQPEARPPRRAAGGPHLVLLLGREALAERVALARQLAVVEQQRQPLQAGCGASRRPRAPAPRRLPGGRVSSRGRSGAENRVT